MIELARVVVDTCLIVPKGVLCFVSSYNVLNLLKESIEHCGLIVPLQARKVGRSIYIIKQYRTFLT